MEGELPKGVYAFDLKKKCSAPCVAFSFKGIPITIGDHKFSITDTSGSGVSKKFNIIISAALSTQRILKGPRAIEKKIIKIIKNPKKIFR